MVTVDMDEFAALKQAIRACLGTMADGNWCRIGCVEPYGSDEMVMRAALVALQVASGQNIIISADMIYEGPLLSQIIVTNDEEAD